MPTNVFFENYSYIGEQELLEDLIVESIQIYGQDMYYLPRRLNTYDKILGEDDTSSYDTSYMFEFYLKNVDGFGGDGSFLSKFDMEIRDRITLVVSRRVFEEEVTLNEEDIVRPREGDLIYFPLNKKCFQIKYVEKFPMFYPLGTLPTYEIQCELFEYSNEIMDTGIPEIDELQTRFDTNIYDFTLRTEDGYSLMTERNEFITIERYISDELENMEENKEFQEESDDILDFTTSDPFSERGSY